MSYKKPSTEKELIELFNSVSEIEFNWKCDIPVNVNTRLYGSLGRYKYMVDREGNVVALGFDFNKDLLSKDYPLDKIINTIKHELVHWYTNKKQGKPCHHNNYFIENCKSFGVSDPTDFERYKKREILNKGSYYEARCCGCDRIVAKGKSMANLKKYMNRFGGSVCSCNNGKRYIIDKGIKTIYDHGRNFFGYQQEEIWIDDLADSYKIILCKEV